ncbi:hypothetical protein [Levilactobacillus namurensis]|uniref:XRE family transcriptional regulator n=1 Tax=Levilactobacillus namurensis TaxID=380393 RepID=A0AAW8W4K9_9LACO|nr:hypothetical protein [Levilactobacillus namurensis]MDT7013672.1 hypothetical protein [Levilactobacillus namurensis]
MTKHTIGAVLKALRLEKYGDSAGTADFEYDIRTIYDIQPWAYWYLERQRAGQLDQERLVLVCQIYDLTPESFAQLQVAPDLSAAVHAHTEAIRAHQQWQHRRERLAWPDSAMTAAQLTDPTTRPEATHRPEDILRYVRLASRWTVAHMAAYFELPDLLYWQMEVGLIPLSDEIDQWLCTLLNTDDLTTFTQTPDLDQLMRFALQQSTHQQID